MGGYGGQSGRIKEKCYYDTGGHKVKDRNSIAVAEYYIKNGRYVAFLRERPPEKRSDLYIDGCYVEVKGLTTLNVDVIEKRLKYAFQQIKADECRETNNTSGIGKVILLSKHDSSVSDNQIYAAFYKGYIRAKNKGYISAKLEFWIRERIYEII